MFSRLYRGIVLTTLLWGVSLGSAAQVISENALLEQGRLVALEADCAGCHTNSKVHGAPYAGGAAIASPLGVIFSTNITPDRRTGIGSWTEAQFSAALRKGKAPEHYLYPAMPYPDYARLSDADIHALYIFFLRGVPPVHQENIPTKLDFPFNVRALMLGWNAFFNRASASPSAEPGQSSIERGKYLVDAVAHCSTCHTPRNVLMASDSRKYLQGGEVAGWFAPDLTPAPGGLGDWSREEIVTYLATGHVKGKAQAGGSMAEAVQASFRLMPQADLKAIATYLKSLPSSSTEVEPVVASERMDDRPNDAWQGRASKVRREAYQAELAEPGPIQNKNNLAINNGAVLYNAACAACHQLGGTGDNQQYYPSLSHNSAIQRRRPNNLIMAILQGIDRRGSDQHVLMPAFEKDMNDMQIAEVANYVLDNFGSGGGQRITSEMVHGLRYGGSENIGWIKVIMYGAVLSIFLLLVIIFVYLHRRRKVKAT